MNKQEFLAELRRGLRGMAREELEERLLFYGEMIDDRMEEGLSEEEAVRAIGSVDEIVSQIVMEIPLAELFKQKIKLRRALRAWEIVLLVLGAPVWLSILIAAVAVVLSLYVVLWSAIASVWAVFASLAGSVVGLMAMSVVMAMGAGGAAGLVAVGAALACAGLAIFAFFGCKAATKSAAVLTKQGVLITKKAFLKGGEAA